jgi:hypothetical protein
MISNLVILYSVTSSPLACPRNGKLTSVIFIRDKNSKGQEVSTPSRNPYPSPLSHLSRYSSVNSRPPPEQSIQKKVDFITTSAPLRYQDTSTTLTASRRRTSSHTLSERRSSCPRSSLLVCVCARAPACLGECQPVLLARLPAWLCEQNDTALPIYLHHHGRRPDCDMGS